MTWSARTSRASMNAVLPRRVRKLGPRVDLPVDLGGDRVATHGVWSLCVRTDVRSVSIAVHGGHAWVPGNSMRVSRNRRFAGRTEFLHPIPHRGSQEAEFAGEKVWGSA